VDIRGKKFLVIGGAGLVGSHCVDELVQEDNVRRFYKTRRVGQKNPFMLAWDGVQIRRVLEKFRQVCKGRFREEGLG
jgi:uncharacterized protein YbjT (DUF2867 family)